MKVKKFIVIIASILFLVSLTGAWIVYKKYTRLHGYDINKTLYPVTGIDISQHTGIVDFSLIRQENIDFIYMKSTEGGDYVDPLFERNYKEAKNAGFTVGCYHLFRYNVPGKIQARNYLHAITDKEFDLPLVADVEEGKPGEKYNREVVISELKIFLEELENAGYLHPIIYTNKKNYSIFIEEELNNYNLWIAHLDSKPSNRVNWLFWQHWLNKKIPGAEGYIDMNTFNGSREDWFRYLQKD
ncbi:hypothetical protein LJB92_04285 [Bacteroidales bacterium OttesenSCG-928-M06]|nr:hypothetical protein [Bacteroidales bacterium OttesenSCG-928-M06]